MTRLNYSLPISTDARDLRIYESVRHEVELGVRAFKLAQGELAGAFFNSALQKLTPQHPFYDHLTHNLILSYNIQAENLLRAGDVDSLDELLKRALALEIRGEMTANEDFRRRFSGAFQELGLTLFKHRRHEWSLACDRKAFEIFPAASSHINLTNSLAATGMRATLCDFSNHLIPENLGKHIFIACVPKSASTFLKNLLVSLTGFKDVFMVYAASQNEHDLYLPTLLENACDDTVTQQHCRASDANVHMLQAFGIRPVVLVRNVFDSVVSLLDFYNQGAYFHSYFRDDFQSLSSNEKIDLLIDNVIPWYFQFVSSWSSVERRQKLEILWINYEDLTGDKTGTAIEILRFYGLGAARRRVDEKVREIEADGNRNRFNKGIKGRGEVCLSKTQKERIRSFSRYFPATNFDRIGL